jgi:hypothetical protein
VSRRKAGSPPAEAFDPGELQFFYAPGPPPKVPPKSDRGPYHRARRQRASTIAKDVLPQLKLAPDPEGQRAPVPPALRKYVLRDLELSEAEQGRLPTGQRAGRPTRAGKPARTDVDAYKRTHTWPETEIHFGGLSRRELNRILKLQS